MAAGRPKFVSGDQFRGTTAEKVSANDTYMAYCGRYEIQGSKVIHHLEASFFPNWNGTAQERLYQFDGDSLTLITPPIFMSGTMITSRLVWNRVDRA